MKLVFATNNEHKIKEIKAILPPSVTLLTLAEAGIHIDLHEPFDTLEKNAIQKANTVYELAGMSCFSEDTGLEVEALGGLPGVHSARYAGEERSDQKNMDKLLSALQGTNNRKARFRTVVCTIHHDKEYLFEGICTGTITEKQQGSNGFGYDSIFLPEGAGLTFAQMSLPEKAVWSHRRKAADKLVAFLKDISLNL